MLRKFIYAKWQTFYGNIQKRVAQRHQAQLIQTTHQREQYVCILQKRYGYTKEKAIDEFERHYAKVRFY